MRWRKSNIILKCLLIASLLFTGAIFQKAGAQSPICGPGVPFFNCDLTGQPGGTWTSNPPISRGGLCCNAQSPDKCIEFLITLDVGAVGINFQIASGAVPPGALFYQIDCGPMIPVGSPICLNGPGPYRLTFCKPGNNINSYSITSIPAPKVSPTTTTSDGCNIMIGAAGLVESSVTWTSLSPGTQGQYNNYLSCTTGCDTVKVSPQPGYPAYVDYRVCGTPMGGICASTSVFCDTVRVYFVPPIANTITPNPASYCVNNPGVTLNANINGGVPPYTYIWKNGGGITVGSNSTYYATSPGSYVLEVRDATYPGCPPKLATTTVTVDPMPTVNAGPDHTVCPGNPNVNLAGSVTNATGGIWSGGSGTYSPSNTALNAIYTPSASEIAAGIVVLTLTTTGNGACAPVTDQMRINITQPISIALNMPAIICYGTTANITATATGGTAPYQYSWSNGSTSNTITNVVPGSYTVTVTDATANACVRSRTAVLNQNPPISLTVPSNTIITCDSSVAVTVSAQGGSGVFAYQWNTGSTSPTITVNSGTYIITATDSVGCIAKDTVTIQAAGTAISASVNQPSVLCYNGTTTLTATGSGGFGAYQYSWNNGQTGTSITVGAGNHCVTVRDTVGCLYTKCITVTEAPQLTVSIPTPGLICYGGTATVTALASGGTPPYTFSWNTGETTDAITKPAGTYTVTVRDANANICSATASVTITQATPLNLSFTSVPTSCFGGNNGTATVTVTGGVGPYNYAWSPYGGNSSTAYTLSAGTYTATISDALGCTQSGSVVVNQPPLLTASITSSTNVTCAGNSNGTATVSVSGGSPSYTYLWSPSNETSASASSLQPGTNVVTVQDSKGCIRTAGINITEPQPLTAVVSSQTNVSCNGGNNGSASVMASGGNAPYSYTWLETGENTSTSSNLYYGNYNVIIRDTKGCSISATVTIQQPPLLTSSITSSSNITCYGAANGSATVTANGGTPGYNYSWSGTTINTASAQGLSPASYTVTVTDLNGCQTTSSVLISQPMPLRFSQATVTPVTCAGMCNGQVSVAASGGNGQYSYLWTPGNYTSGTVSNLCAGTYSVRVTDLNGCFKDTSLTITQPAALMLSSTATGSNCSQPNGSATVTVNGGTPGYTYSWNTSPAQFTYSASNLTPGTYTVNVTDNNSCSTSLPVVIQNIPGVTATISSSSSVSCNSLCNGSATVSSAGGTGPFVYSWNTVPSQNSPTATALCAGTYTVRVTGSDGCSDTKSVIITEPTPLMLSTVSSANVNCYGDQTGSATINASGGSGSYNYSWSTSPVQTGATATNLAAGVYIVTVQDNNNCTDTIHVSITQPSAALQVTTSNTNLYCYGGTNASATASATGGSPSYTYSWSTSPTQTTPTASNLSAGTYSVTITDTKGCITSSSPVVVTQPAASLSVTTTNTNVNCYGSSTGTAQATVTGGTAPYNYTWSTTPVQSSPTASNLAVGTYSVSITDAQGCGATSTIFSVSGPSNPLTATTTKNDVNCYGGSTGTASVSASGGTTPYTYSWSTSPSQTTATASGLVAGTYSVLVTDNNGCTYSNNSIIITQPQYQLSATVSVTGVNCFGGNNGTATITASGGSPGYSYTWSTTPVQYTPTATNLAAGTYSAVVSDTKGCTVNTGQVVITQPAAALNSTFTSTNVACFGNNNGTATANVSGGTSPYTYSWSTTPSQTTPSATNLAAGTYSVSITDANGCMLNSGQITISGPSEALAMTISRTHINCYGQNTGSAQATVTGGTSPYTYSWSTNPVQTTASATGLGAGTYTLLITDQNGCTSTNNSIVLTQPTGPLTINMAVTHVNCFGQNTGNATITATGGTPGYSYTWNTTPVQYTPTATNLAAGTYTAVVTDTKGCTVNTGQVVITQPAAALNSTFTSTNVACFGNNNGTATANVSGGTSPYTYSWSTTPSQTTPSATNLAAGTYSVNITDAKGCMFNSGQITISGPSEGLAVNITKTNVSCFGGNTGSAQALVTGGTSPYTYSWSTSPVQNTSTASNLSAGTYTLNITDQNGCSYSNNGIVITQPVQGIASAISVTNVTCYGDNNGSASATVTGGTSPYNYSWNTNPVQNTPTASLLFAGTYTLQVTDANGCVYTSQPAIVSQPATALSVTTTKTNIPCFGMSTGSATATATGGTGPYNFSWNTSPAQLTATANNLSAGYYTVTVTDNNNCSFAVGPIQITQPAASLGGTVSSTNVSCYGQIDGTATVIPNGGTAPYSYSWNTSPLQTTATASGLPAGNYFVRITDANGCTTNSATVNIIQPTILNASITNTVNLTCAGANNGSATVSATGGTSPYYYSWNTSPAQTLSTASNLAAGNYTATVVDMRGCRDSVNVQIAEPASVQLVSAGAFATTCNETCDGYAVVIAGGGSAPYSYSWSNGGNGPSINNLCEGFYSIFVYDNKGCYTDTVLHVTSPVAILLTETVTASNCYQLNGSATVTPDGGMAAYSYSWSSSPPSFSSTLNGVGPGDYEVTVTDARGCKSSKVVTIPNIPGVKFTSSVVDNARCKDSCDATATVIASSGTAPYTYFWNTTPPQFVSTASNLCAGSYKATVRDEDGCWDTISVNITEPSYVSIACTDTPRICVGQSATLTATANGGTGDFTFSWNNGQANTASFTVSPVQSTNYTVCVSDSNGCRSEILTVPVVVNAPVSVQLAKGDSICPGGIATVHVEATGGDGNYEYSWTPGNITTSDFAVTPSATTTYYVTVKDGCGSPTANDSARVVVHSLPNVNFTPDVREGCKPLCVTFNNNSSVSNGNISQWNWSFSTGQNSSEQNPQVCFNEDGSSDLTVEAISNYGCRTTMVYPGFITVHPDPVANFSFTPKEADILNPSIKFTDESEGAVSWHWDFGNENGVNYSTEQNPSCLFSDTGRFCPLLTVTSKYGCVSQKEDCIYIEPQFSFYIPNAFSPNGDGYNETFSGVGTLIQEYEMLIFDRWGNLIYSTDDLEKPWDGKANGGTHAAQEDVYVYKIKLLDVNRRPHQYIGSVTIVK